MTAPPPTMPAAALPDGFRLGKYEILGRTGQGGMAVVYRARDTLLDRIVALKQIAPHLAEDPHWTERFRQEAQTVARIASGSRHIVQIHELIEDPRGLFIVMEFVEGYTLEALIRDEQLDLQLALDILGGVCLGLRTVHAAGIVHRDIKPANILVPFDRRAKITDFGIAARQGGDALMTLGTTKYMAPELFGAAAVDGRADIYSLGFVAFEMFAGRRAMERHFADVLADDRSAATRWMNWHLSMDQHLPRLDALDPMIPPALAEIVAQMAAKSHNVRYPDIIAVIQDLKRSFVPAGGGGQPAQKGQGVEGPRGQGTADSSNDDSQTPDSSTPRPLAPPTPRSLDPSTPLLKVGTSTITAPAGFFDSDSPTAPLNRPAASGWRRGLLLAACAAGAIIVGLVGGSLLRGSDQFSQMERLRTEGNAAYEALRYDEALAKWREAEKQQASGARAEKVRVELGHSIPLAEAEIALARGERQTADKKWNAARDDFAVVAAKLSEADRRGADRPALAALRESLAKAQAALDARERLERLLADGDLEQAGLFVRDIADRAVLDAATLADLKAGLDQARGSATYMSQFRQARQALERGEFDRALELAQQAKSQQATDEVTALIEQITAAQACAQALKAGSDAMEAKEYHAAAQHFAEARKLNPKSAEANAKYKNAAAQEQLAAAREARRDGKLKEAAIAYADALKFAELPDARSELTALTAQLVYQQKVEAGQHAADAGDWDAAVRVWQDALTECPKEGQDALRAKISKAQVQAAVKRGEKLAREKRWGEARAALEEAIRLGGGKEVKARLRRVQNEQSVAALLAQGDAARDKGLYDEAIKRYREAGKLRERGDAEIQKHLDEVNYRQFKESGTRKLRAGQYRAALADLRQAQRLRPDDKEVARMIAEAEQKGG